MCLATRALPLPNLIEGVGAILQTSTFLLVFPPSALSPLMLCFSRDDLGVLGTIQSMPGLGDILNKLEATRCFQLKVL